MTDKEKIIKAYNKWVFRYAKSNGLLLSEVGNVVRKYENRHHRYITKIVKDALKNFKEENNDLVTIQMNSNYLWTN